ncbi:MAG: ABC transporter permease, partial [Ruminococcus sp.]|nr:ABC transporter permease [Ruminococcus sp.]
YLFASPDVKNFYLTADIGEILWGNTVDTAFMIMLLGLVAAASFAGEFSSGTIKNVIIYNSRKEVYIAKVVSVLIVVFAMLFIWYASGLCYAIISRGELATVADLSNYFLRFSVQYLVILIQTALIAIVGILFEKLAIANISTIFFWLAITFVPINGEFASDFLESQYMWGKIPSFLFYLTLILSILGIYLLGYAIFRRKQIV